jgi:hypothetical protein
MKLAVATVQQHASAHLSVLGERYAGGGGLNIFTGAVR